MTHMDDIIFDNIGERLTIHLDGLSDDCVLEEQII